MKLTLVNCALLFIFCTCNTAFDPETFPAQNQGGSYNAVIEIPAGTNHKIEYNKASGKFEVDLRDGKERVIKFLPYPGNYGFIPGTMMAENQGGDGDALDVLIIAESLPTGSVIKFKPLTMLRLIDDGEMDYKVIGVPENQNLNTLGVNSYEELAEHHPNALSIIESWFLNYDNDPATSNGWASEKETIEEIERWLIE